MSYIHETNPNNNSSISPYTRAVDYKNRLPRRGRALIDAGLVASLGLLVIGSIKIAESVTGANAPQTCIEVDQHDGDTVTANGKNALLSMDMNPGAFATGELAYELREAFNNAPKKSPVYLCANKEYANYSIHNQLPELGDGFELYLGTLATTPK